MDLRIGDDLKLERNLLRHQATTLLRDHIISGRVAPGTKLAEREVAELLGISRAPARDALMELEKEGLIVSLPGGRRVIEPTERDIVELYQVRLALERLAVELATAHNSPENREILSSKLAEMHDAIESQDRKRYVASDIEIHRLIWDQADNRHLRNTLRCMIGPITMFVARHAESHDWNETYDLHQDLIACINAGDVEEARTSIEHHMHNSRQRALEALRGDD